MESSQFKFRVERKRPVSRCGGDGLVIARLIQHPGAGGWRVEGGGPTLETTDSTKRSEKTEFVVTTYVTSTWRQSGRNVRFQERKRESRDLEKVVFLRGGKGRNFRGVPAKTSWFMTGTNQPKLIYIYTLLGADRSEGTLALECVRIFASSHTRSWYFIVLKASYRSTVMLLTRWSCSWSLAPRYQDWRIYW